MPNVSEVPWLRKWFAASAVIGRFIFTQRNNFKSRQLLLFNWNRARVKDQANRASQTGKCHLLGLCSSSLTVRGYFTGKPVYFNASLSTRERDWENPPPLLLLSWQNIFHGSMPLDQLYLARPLPCLSNYRSPVKGLYLCGSGSHPGLLFTNTSAWWRHKDDKRCFFNPTKMLLCC